MAARLQHKIHFGALYRQVAKRALVMHLLDIRVNFGEAGRHFRQRAGQIAQFHFNLRQASGTHHAAFDDVRQH